MRRIKRFLKFLSYSLLFMIISLGSAYGVITISLNNAANIGNKQSGSADGSIPEEITSIINNFVTSKNIEAQSQININTDSENIVINISNGKIDLSQGIDNLVIDSDISVDLLSLNNQISFNIRYKNGVVYIEGFNSKFKIETENLISSVKKITDLFNIKMPDLGNLDMGSLDINAILGALRIENETETENGISLDVAIPAINGKIYLKCDKNYKLQELIVPEMDVNEIKISANGNLDYTNNFSIKEIEEDEFVNLSPVLDYTQNLNILDKKSIGFDFVLSYQNKNLNGNLFIELETLNIMLKLDWGKISPTITVVDNIAYFDAGDTHLKFNLSDLEKLQPILNRFDIDISLRNISQILGNVKTNGVKSILGLLSNSKFNVETLDLSNLQNILSQDSKLEIEFKDIGKLVLNSVENKLTDITFTGDDINLKLTTKESGKISFNSDINSYVDLANFVPLVDCLTSLINGKSIYGYMSFDYKEYSLTVNYQLILDDNLFLKANCQIFDKDFEIIFKDNQIFVNFSNTKIKLNSDDFNQLLNTLSYILDVDLTSTNLNVMSIISLVFDSEAPLAIKSISEIDGDAIISLQNNMDVTLSSDKNVLKIELNDKAFKINCSAQSGQETNVPSINEEEYTDFNNLPAIENLYDYFKANKFYFKYNFTFSDITLNGGINIDNNNLLAVCNFNYKGIAGVAGINDDKIYLNFEKVYLSFDVQDFDIVKNLLSQFGINLDELDGLLNEKLGINIEKILDMTRKQAFSLIKNLSSQEILSKLEKIFNKFEINLTSEKLIASSIENAYAEVSFKNDMIYSANIDYQNFKGSLTLLDNPYVYKFNKKYVDCGNLINIVDNFITYLKNGKFAVNTDISTNEGKNLSALIQLDKPNSKLSTEISSNIKGGIDAKINIDGGITYINVNGILLKLNNQNLKEILCIALELFDIDLSGLNTFKNVDLEDLDMTTLKSYTPTFDNEKILLLLNSLKSLEKKSNNYILTIDGTDLLNNAKANNITLTIFTNGSTITDITVQNVYALSLNEQFEVKFSFSNSLNFKEFDKTLSYIDISNSGCLLKALINMSQAKAFNIKGSVNLNGKVIGISISRTIDFDVKINFNENKQIELYGIVGPIPAIVGVNNDVPYESGDTNAGSNRYLYFYYKDGYVYLYRSEYVKQYFGIGTRTYEKCVKVSLETFLDNPLSFIQYGIGFSENIKGEIESSSEQTNNTEKKETDYSKIITSFTSSSSSFKIGLNVGEIINNSKIGNLEMEIQTSSDDNGKDYISDITLSLSMPLSSLLSLDVKSNNISITKYDYNIKMEELNSFTENYSYGEGEYWEASDKDWIMKKETMYTIKFETDSHQTVESITKKPGESITLPSLNSYVSIYNGYRVYRTFAGWYTDKNLNNKFTGSTMPGIDLTLYAKWNERVEKVYAYDDLII